MELYIVRHGQTPWNLEGRLQGKSDVELNGTGRQDAIALGERLEAAGISFDVIYASPLIRAYETACLIRGRQNIPIIRDERLRELAFGVCEGDSYQKLLKADEPFHFFFDAPGQYTPPEGGESLQQLCRRTRSFIKEVIESAAEEYGRIMIVAHGALNKGLMSYLEGNSIERFWGDGLQKNCEAEVFTFQKGVWKKRIHV